MGEIMPCVTCVWVLAPPSVSPVSSWRQVGRPEAPPGAPDQWRQPRMVCHQTTAAGPSSPAPALMKWLAVGGK